MKEEQKINDLKNEIAEIKSLKKKYDGNLVVDEYLALIRITNRLDAIADSATTADCDMNNAAWRSILEDEALNALEGLKLVKKKIEEKSTVIEYLKARE